MINDILYIIPEISTPGQWSTIIYIALYFSFIQ